MEDVTVGVSFRVKCSTQFGDRVFVVGDASQLGSWRVAAGVELTTSRSMYPTYVSATIDLPSGFQSFKFVTVAADGAVTCEEGSNR